MEQNEGQLVKFPMEAVDLISYQPIALYKHEVPLKGIQANEEVYEIRSVLLDNVPIKVSDGAGIINEEEFIRYFTSEVEEEDFLRDSPNTRPGAYSAKAPSPPSDPGLLRQGSRAAIFSDGTPSSPGVVSKLEVRRPARLPGPQSL